MIAAVYCYENCLYGIILALQQFPPKLDDLHLSIHDFQQETSEDVELLENGLVLRVGDLWILDPFCDKFPQLEVVLRKQENCKFQSTYLSYLHVVEPAKSVG
jgi:hypothetical protein